MPSLKPFTVTPRSLHELIIMPQFGDYIADGAIVPSTEEGDWMLMDDVVYERPILDLKGHANILKRRDATCKLAYSPVGKLTNRYIRTEKLYGASEECQEEFYQGCFEDYSQENFDLFGAQVMPLMERGIATDIYTNKYFGDINRVADPNGTWSWNKFDGVFKRMASYIASGVITSGQTFAIASGAITPANAKAALDSAYSKQDLIMKQFPKAEKIIYVDENLADAYWDYLVNAGISTIADRMNGKIPLLYKGIEVKVKQWDGIMAALVGAEAHAIVFTVKGNFLYATDKTYGGGPRRNEAVRVWWSDDDNVWRRQFHLKAGTEIVAPQHIVLGITTGII
jgi:hypothetical protein